MRETSAADFSYLPSDPLAHHVERHRPLEAWEELVCRTMRFGRPITLAKGTRLELQNVKVVIAEPVDEPESALEQYKFDPHRFKEYQRKILDGKLPAEISYTYGNRLRRYFRDRGNRTLDTLEAVIGQLRNNSETRHAYISLWDTRKDLRDGDGGDDSVPCLTTLFFRRSEGKLTMTATYRSHNLLTAWLENVYGLASILRYVADGCAMPPGAITVISHSLTINPRETRFSIAEELVKARKKDDDYDHSAKKFTLRSDPHGYFALSVDESSEQIIAVHLHDNVPINRYVGNSAQEIEDQVARDMSISVISHAMWFGRQLAIMEQKLAEAKRRKRAEREGNEAVGAERHETL